MTDILFVIPSFTPQLKEESIGTLILAKIVMAANYNVHMLRYWEVSDNFDDYYCFKQKMIDKVLSFEPCVVSFYSRCTDYHISVDVSNTLKSIKSELKIVFGGPQAELVAHDTLTKFPSIDYICCGEGETTIVPLLDTLLRNENELLGLASISGLVYRDRTGTIHQNPLPLLLPNNYCSVVNYYDLIPQKILKESHRTTLDVGRGCPFSCVFCSTKTFWKQKFRLRNIQDIVNEIEYVVNNIGITRFDLDHDIFTLRKDKVMEFCNELKRRNLSISWHCSSRIDTIDKEMIDTMAGCGLYKIMFGIESASSRIQKIIRKNLNLDDCFDIVTYCRSKGLKVIASFLYGLPEDEEEDFEKSFRMMQDFEKLGVNVSTYLCGILNGTELYEKYHDKLVYSIENVKNHKYFGLEELTDLVSQHPTIFPHLFDIDTPLRIKLRFFEIFRNIWNIFFPNTFGFVSIIFIREGLRYLDMYYMFVESNSIPIKHSKFDDKLFGLSEEQCIELSLNFIHYLRKCTYTGLIHSEEYQLILDLFKDESSKYSLSNHD